MKSNNLKIEKNIVVDEKKDYFFIFIFIFLIFNLFLGQFFIYGKQGNVFLGSIFYSLAIILIIFIEIKYKIQPAEIKVSFKKEIIFFILILFIALFFRIHKITEIPPDLFADEGDKGYQACKMIEGKKIQGQNEFILPIHDGAPCCITTAVTHVYLSAPFIKFFGKGSVQVRTPTIIIAILSVISCYFLMRKMYGIFIAIIGGFLIATMRWHINFSRIAWENMISIFSIIMCLYSGWRAYTERKTIDFIVFGFALALTQYGYQSSRIMPLWVIIFLIYILFFDIYTLDKKYNLKKFFVLIILFLLFGSIYFVLKKYGFWDVWMNQSLYHAINWKKNEIPKILTFIIPISILVILLSIYLILKTNFLRENIKKIIISFLVFSFFFSPMAIYIYKYQFAWMSRGKATLIWNNIPNFKEMSLKQKITKLSKFYFDNVKKSFLAFYHEGDWNPRWNFPTRPHLEFFTGILFTIGLILFLMKFFCLKEFFLLSAFLVLAQATLLNTENPNASRSAVLLPIVIIIISIGLSRIVDYYNFIFKSARRKILYGALTVLILIIIHNNYKEYFIELPKNPDFQYGFSPEEYNMAMTLRKLGPSWRGVVLLRYELRRTFRFLMYGDDSWLTFAPYANIPIREDDGKNYIYMSVFENLPIVPILKEIYPNGEYDEFRTKYWPHKEPVYFIYKVPYSDVKTALYDMIENKRGLDGYYYNNTNWQGEPVTKTVEPFIFLRHFYNPAGIVCSTIYKGKIKIDEDGLYEFKLIATGDGSLSIDNKEIIKLDLNEKLYTETYGISSIYLKKGFHKIEVRYKFKRWHLEMELRWRPPGKQEFEVVPYKVLFRE